MEGNRHEHLNEYFSILSNERRRLAIRTLTELEEVSVSDLSESVASVEYGKDPQKLSSDERKRVYTSMRQVHIPRLEQCGVVRYDGNKVEPTKKNDELAQYIHELEENQGRALEWLFAFAMGSVVLAAVVSILFFWVGVRVIGNLLLATTLLIVVTSITGLCMVCIRILSDRYGIINHLVGEGSE
jgi:DNA-binding transcriptional ArsR family regulator